MDNDGGLLASRQLFRLHYLIITANDSELQQWKSLRNAETSSGGKQEGSMELS